MTQKTINCAECNVEFTFEENPKYPRKYCFDCSEKKKVSFKHASESIPTHTPEGVPVEKIDEKVASNGTQKDNGFEAHLSIENVRSNALASALQFWGDVGKDYDTGIVLVTAKGFEQYILTGE